MKRIIAWTLALAVASSAGFLLGRSRSVRANGNPGASDRRVLYWVDPMHPDYKTDRPGIAPDCGMELQPVYAETVQMDSNKLLQPGTVEIDSARQQTFGIRVVPVERSLAIKKTRILGRVAVDETRVYRVNVGVDGFVKDTRDSGVGTCVRKNQILATVYSPEFLSVVGGYLSASERTQNTGAREAPATMQGAAGAQNWADRLRNLGMSDPQIMQVSQTRKIPEDVYLVSPADGFIVARNITSSERFGKHTEFYRIADLSRVWIQVDIFDRDGQLFRPGALARVTLPGQDKAISARVSDVLPQVDPSTRTLKLRLDAENPGFALRPDMLVDVELTTTMKPGLSVPADAVIDSGLQQHVFVERSNGVLEPREVQTGWRLGDRVQVLRGLREGERVVASGAFLVDSESRLRFSPAGQAPPPGPQPSPAHHHNLAEMLSRPSAGLRP